MAGLSGFDPSPPYSCLPKMIAKLVLKTTIYHGAILGIEMAKRIAVSAAELSLMASIDFFLIFRKRISAKMPVISARVI